MNRLTTTSDEGPKLKKGVSLRTATEMLFEYEELEMTPSEIDEMTLELADARAQLENRPETTEEAYMEVCKRLGVRYKSPEDRAQELENLKAIQKQIVELVRGDDAEEPKPTGMTRAEILNNAMKCVCGDREQDYGKPETSFAMIASLWEPYLRQKCLEGGELTIKPEDVGALMALFKIARIATGHGKADNWIDLAGYAAVGGEIESFSILGGKD